MKRDKIVISTSTFGVFDLSPLKMLTKAGYEAFLNPFGRRLTQSELIQMLPDAVGLIAGTESLTEAVFSHAPVLRAISRCGSGMDTVDIEAAKRHKIIVTNTPDAPVESVAELTLGLILALLRRTGEADRAMHQGEWKPLMGSLLRGKTVGLIGLGRIGRRMVELLRPFHVKFLVREKAPRHAFVKRHGIRLVPLTVLLRESDIVSLHVSLDTETRGMIGAAQLRQMKPSGILINTSRGELVDDQSLAQTLKEGKLTGAGMDVYPTEPYRGPLLECPTAILTSHMGTYAKETRMGMELQAVEHLLKSLRR